MTFKKFSGLSEVFYPCLIYLEFSTCVCFVKSCMSRTWQITDIKSSKWIYLKCVTLHVFRLSLQVLCLTSADSKSGNSA